MSCGIFKASMVVMTFLLLSTLTRAADFSAGSYSEVGDIKRKVLASHFLMRSTFGPKQDEVDALAERMQQIGVKDACEEWIDKQFSDYPMSSDWKAYEPDRGRLWPLTKKMLGDMGYEERNFNKQRGEAKGVYNRNEWKEHAWWHRALTSKDQLRQRMAWALSQIFVVGEGPGVFGNIAFDTSANPRWLGLPKYYDDVCISHAFGNYRELLETMTYSPAMGVWLTTVKNRKASPATGTFPDENYAREIMQLFSIGLVELNEDGTAKLGPDGRFIDTYDNETITALSRVFTGLVYNNNNVNNDSFGAGVNLHFRMDMFEQFHDTEQKVAFGGRLVIPARSQSERNALRDISDVLDFLAYEHENTAPFICRRLIQRLVMSNPPKVYLRRVAKVWNDNKRNPNQFEEVIKAILLDPAARNPIRFKTIRSPRLAVEVVRKFPTERTRLREPVLRFAAMLRAFSPYPDSSFLTDGSKRPYFTPGGPEGSAGNQYFFIDNQSERISATFGQGPFESDTVFNFYEPDYQPPGAIVNYAPSTKVINGKLVSPEFQILSPVTATPTLNHARAFTVDSDYDIGTQWEVNKSTSLDVNLDFSRFFEDGGMLGRAGVEPTLSQLSKMIEELDLALCCGLMSSKTKQTLVNICKDEIDDFNVDLVREKEDLVQAIISVILLSPDCAVIP